MASANATAELFTYTAVEGKGVNNRTAEKMVWLTQNRYQMTATVTATGLPVVWQTIGNPDTATNWSGTCTTQTGYTLAQLTASSIRWNAVQYGAV